MGKTSKTQPAILPTSDEIAKVYQALNLSKMLKAPYDRQIQWGRFRKPSLYTDDTRGYATSNTSAGQEPQEF